MKKLKKKFYSVLNIKKKNQVIYVRLGKKFDIHFYFEFFDFITFQFAISLFKLFCYKLASMVVKISKKISGLAKEK